ncbi:MAG TPA: cytochrome c3 family protein [Anaeromyxobacter sp.]
MKNTFFSMLVAVAVAFASSAFAAEAPAKPITLPAKPGAVTFNHKTHAALKCTQCHADEKGGEIEGFGKTVNKDKAHAKCHECHKKEGKGPQKCADCHKKA